MKDKETLFDQSDPAAEERADARADTDVRDGRLIGHRAVKRWLRSWVNGEPLPRPRTGD